MLTPSARTILDRETRSAIPAHTLSQPATDPPNTTGPGLSYAVTSFLGVAFDSLALGRGRSGGGVITNLDLLYAVHTTLLTRITQEEWGALGHGSRAQQKVTRAYERRCTRMGGGWEGGVRRIDWLGEKTCLVGVEIDRSSASACTGKLVFGKP
ncbi:hypothetical protein A0H81_06651 [Grifola frondosa]|uniref:DUF6699 domain-containing protein n=1 Tax=Grifola frondosa TaxID=5627 RepID=A0A1C7M881_GRIFR|nr:hypothetical protein A0H81_06651 [Grifola frondosa]